MTRTLDLGAYLERIGWNGDARSDLATLAALLDAHMTRIPFENLDVLLGRGIRLDLDGLQRKLVDARRGGYCFEHATLFAAALEALGFAPIRHAAALRRAYRFRWSMRRARVAPTRIGSLVTDATGCCAPARTIR
jgi:N-hydroxyarylamine O-acetyltransferase